MSEWVVRLFSEHPKVAVLTLIGSVVCAAVVFSALVLTLIWAGTCIEDLWKNRQARRERSERQARAEQIDAWARKAAQSLRAKKKGP